MSDIVAILDDDAASRDALRWLVESVGFSARVFHAPHELLHWPDLGEVRCFVIDVRLPDMSGVRVLEELRAARIGAAAVLISGHARISDAVRAMKLGAFDFIEKPINGQQLLDSIQLAILEVTEKPPAGDAPVAPQGLWTRISPREREIAELLVDGHTNKTVARVLGISVRTVEWHRRNLMHKLEARTMADLVKLVMEVRAPAGLHSPT